MAEYAVDLSFGFTAWNVTGASTQLATVTPDDSFTQFFPDDQSLLGQVQHVRAIRARLSVRSREGDRPENVDLPGLYRIGLGEDGGAPFARVRTLQADIALHNFGRTEW